LQDIDATRGIFESPAHDDATAPLKSFLLAMRAKKAVDQRFFGPLASMHVKPLLTRKDLRAVGEGSPWRKSATYQRKSCGSEKLSRNFVTSKKLLTRR
jgi:hypothetical protein